MSDFGLGADFRRMCRDRTRNQLLALQRQYGVFAAVPNTHIAELIEHARAELTKQQEPDGTRDIVSCFKCHQKNRMPLSGQPARCAKCKEVLQ